MRPEVQERLLELNRTFYQTFAESFAETRRRLQPGVVRALDSVDPDDAVLDLGCGIGEVASELARRGHRAAYLGLDVSSNLLALARQRSNHPQARFECVDLASSGWTEAQNCRADLACMFALLHHIPGEGRRRRLLEQAAACLPTGGRLLLSSWNFKSSDRLLGRVVPWEAVDLTAEDVDTGDHLLDWRRGGTGLRYVHHFDEAKLRALAAGIGCRVVDSYYSDGENGRLGYYQIWLKG